MPTFRILSIAALGAVATLGLHGAGIASADDYAGQTYADASSAIANAGDKAVIASRFGDELGDDNDCVVTHSQMAAWRKGDDFAPVTDTVLVDLNCDAAVATATTAGNSAASPEGRAALEAAKEKAAKENAAASSS